MAPQNPIDKLIQEFQGEAGLTEVEARRSAFIVLAHSRGWTNAKIGRYLGIGRQRVGQRLDKILLYVHGGDVERGDPPRKVHVAPKKMPTTKKVLAMKHKKTAVLAGTNGSVVEFLASDWERAEFAMGLLEQVAG